MVTFEESRQRRGNSGGSRRSSGPRRDSGRDSSRGRNDSFSRNSKPRGNKGRRDIERTMVECSLCKTHCEVPFKPTSNKPVYCDACFAKKGAATANKISENDLDIINAKLNKIMKALNIE